MNDFFRCRRPSEYKVPTIRCREASFFDAGSRRRSGKTAAFDIVAGGELFVEVWIDGVAQGFNASVCESGIPAAGVGRSKCRRMGYILCVWCGWFVGPADVAASLASEHGA